MDDNDVVLIIGSFGGLALCPLVGVICIGVLLAKKAGEQKTKVELPKKKENKIIHDMRFENCDIILTDDNSSENAD